MLNHTPEPIAGALRVREIEAAGIGRREMAVRLSLDAPDGCASMSRFPERCQIRLYDELRYRSIYRIDNVSSWDFTPRLGSGNASKTNLCFLRSTNSARTSDGVINQKLKPGEWPPLPRQGAAFLGGPGWGSWNRRAPERRGRSSAARRARELARSCAQDRWAESGKICHQQILFMDIELLHQKQSKRSYFHHQALSNESWMMRSTAGPAQLISSSSATADAYAG